MPQEFHVLQCYSCSTFQVHQVKKSNNKWSCKLCGEKQSIKKVFGRGSGADCRHHVQRLNTLRQEQNMTKSTDVYNSSYSTVKDEDLRGVGSSDTEHEEPIRICGNSGSKWSQYVEKVSEDSINEILQPGEEHYTTDGNQFYGRRKRKRENGNRKGMKSGYDSEDSSKMSWKTDKKNLRYGDENYNIPQPSQPSCPVTQADKLWQKSTQEKYVAEIKPIQDIVAIFKERDSLLDTKDQNIISENIAKPRPKTTKLDYSNQKGKSNGSKWDQFIEEKEDTEPENSDEECPEIPEVMQPQSVECRSLQNKLVCQGKRIGNKSGDSEPFKSGDQALFSVGDLEDSDFDI